MAVTDAEKVRLESIFTHHAPKGAQAERYGALRDFGLSLAMFIAKVCPDSREKAVALTKLQEVIMWANAAIAINE